jgi:hypothetical protein
LRLSARRSGEVNARNPLPGLTLEQVARVFNTGGIDGDLTD